MRDLDWDKIEADVLLRIKCLRALDENSKGGPLFDKIFADLILPAVIHLGKFVECVTVTEGDGDLDYDCDADE